jgi:hypothetical protein
MAPRREHPPDEKRRSGGGGEGSRNGFGQKQDQQCANVIPFARVKRASRVQSGNFDFERREPYRALIRVPVHRQGRLVSYRWIRVSRELAQCLADMAESRR